jgi:hypothetical protein
METEFFQHPRRFPQNANGPFYTTGHQCPRDASPNAPLVWCADCLQCEAPEAEAPELLAELTDQNLDTYFIAQPTTDAEIAAACMAVRVCCTSALRYGGRERNIIAQLNNDPEYCDYIDVDGQLCLTIGDDGELLPFAKRIVDAHHRRLRREHQRLNMKWWQFWR